MADLLRQINGANLTRPMTFGIQRFSDKSNNFVFILDTDHVTEQAFYIKYFYAAIKRERKLKACLHEQFLLRY